MQTITFLRKLGFGDVADNAAKNIKLEEILIELPNEKVVEIDDIFFLSNPNRTIIRAKGQRKDDNNNTTRNS